LRGSWQSGKRAAALWALIGTGLFIGWQSATVERNFGGNWTSLFYTGKAQRIPPDLIRGTFTFEGPGYDGQMYRYVAHDPWVEGADHNYLDDYSLRQRRILVPALAWLLALGRWDLIDFADLAILSAFVFAGCYWASLWIMLQGDSPAWGLAYMIVPSTLVAADRCTIDVATSSLTIALLLYSRLKRDRFLFLSGMAICLSRETGLLVLLGVILSLAFERQWRRGLALSTAAIPALAWYAYVYLHREGASRPSIPGWLGKGSPLGIFIRLTHPIDYHLRPAIDRMVQGLDCVALAGMLLAFGLAVFYWSRNRTGSAQITGVLFLLLLPLVSSAPFWDAAYGYSRPFSPLLVSIAMGSAHARAYRWVGMVPIFLVLPRLLLQMGPQIAGIFHVYVR
jgi:hypothetical protein